MDIHEYQGKSILKSFGVAIQEGIVAETPEQAVAAAKELKVKYKTGTYTKQGKTYQKKDVYIMKGKTQQVQQGGVRQVQNAYASAKKLIINIAKGDFPKNKL